MKKLLLFSFIFIYSTCFSATYYVATNGNDNNLGTAINIPFLTITKAISRVVAGDIIYVRGGMYNITAKISINKSGTAVNRITLMGYPGDTRPIINGTSMTTSTNNRGLELSGSYWTIKGIDIMKAGDNGMHISGAFNIIDQCNFYENRDTGCQLANGANNNQIINCDSYFNRDSTSATNKDGNADGFAAKLDVGTGNSFKGCRAWQNSDDGWDGLLSTGIGTNPSTTYDSCWCFLNGYLKSGVASTGNGNGFKVGGNNERHDALVTRSLAAYNRVKGFDQNNNNGSMTFYNCTGYRNRPNFGLNNNDPDAGEVMVVKNCISFGSLSADVFRTVCVRTNNSWQSPVTTSAADFISVDSLALRSARKADGSLPNINFMQLVKGSDLINAGTNVGLSFNGSAPDLGCFETNYPLPVKFYSYTLQQENIHEKVMVKNIWATASEINTAYFNIQRSIDGVNFETVGKMVANGLAGNYTYFDDITNLNKPYQFFYKLEAVDKDGIKTFSSIVPINIKKRIKEIRLYPNPAKELLFITNSFSTANYSIVNANGMIVKVGTINTNNAVLNIKDLAAGTYFMKVISNEKVETFKINKL
jgi:hypothetical protein